MATVVDAHIMTRVASADREAVGILYDRYGATLLPVALRILGNRADAEDVLHDAFVTLPERARHYSPERGSVAAWLVILVRNLSIDRTRRRGVRQTLSEGVVAEASHGATNPETMLDLAKKQDRVRRALASLPDAQRQTLQTAFFEGLSYPEIAARDGVSLGTVKSRAARALAALRAALAAEGLADDALSDDPAIGE
jgi:RNA polymerase sigma-70 factor (ECF subfamily)